MALRWRRLLPGLWAGVLLCIALIATPAIFAALPSADAGKVVSRIFVQEAWLSLALAGVLLLLDRNPAPIGRLAAQSPGVFTMCAADMVKYSVMRSCTTCASSGSRGASGMVCAAASTAAPPRL